MTTIGDTIVAKHIIGVDTINGGTINGGITTTDTGGLLLTGTLEAVSLNVGGTAANRTIKCSGTDLGFFGVAPAAQRVLASAASTADVVTFLHDIGLAKAS